MKLKLIGALTVAAALVASTVYASAPLDAARVSEALKTRLPKTAVSAIDCNKLNGLCEVVAGNNLFYVDGKARYLFVGRVYDMETRQDMTAAKLLEINPSMLLGGAAAAGGDESQDISGIAQAARNAGGIESPGTQRKIDLSPLGKAGAIIWGKPEGEPVTIFTDFRCGYCRSLAAALETMNVKVIERPISTLGTRDLSNKVYCAKNKAKAVVAAYRNDPLPTMSCDTSGLDANEQFARAQGFSGTPIIVRKDGTVLVGYRPKEFLESWLKGGS